MKNFEAALARDATGLAQNEAGAPWPSNPFVEGYLHQIEDLLDSDEKRTIDVYLDRILLDTDGEPRDYNDIAKDIFLSNHDTRISSLLQDHLGLNLKDYLLTRIDVLLGRVPPPTKPQKVSGFRVIKGGKALETASGEIDHLSDDIKQAGREKVVDKIHKKVSAMDLEGLISDATIGSISPRVHCQCDYDFALPNVSGLTRSQSAPPTPEKIRFLPQMSKDQIRRDNVAISLPRERISDGVLPVPYGFQIVGALEQPIAVVDAGGIEPFRTRLMDEIEQDTLTYILSFIGNAASVDYKAFAPTEAEKQELNECLPIPEELRNRGVASLSGAREVVSGLMGKDFLYVCDDRLGGFIDRHPEELGTIMEGLKVGHCDLLAWCASVYYRQMGHAVCVVNSEVSGKKGDGFLRKCTHSRVGIFKPNGSLNYLDPSGICRAVSGYSLENTSDAMLEDMEDEFDRAHNREEKLTILRKLRYHINNLERLRYEEFYGGPPMATLDKPFDELEDINVTEDDITALVRLINEQYKDSLSHEARIEMNKLCDKLASIGLPVFFNAIMMLTHRSVIRQTLRNGSFDSLLKIFGSAFFTCDDVTRKLFPEFTDEVYAEFAARDELNYDNLEEPFPRQAEESVRSLPNVEALMHFSDGFRVERMTPGDKYPVGYLCRLSLYYKLVALALVDDRARKYASERFALDDDGLKEFAYKYEPSLRPSAPAKTIVTSARAFTGKPKSEDYEEFRKFAERTCAALTVDKNEYRLASASFFRALSSLHLRSGPATWDAESDYFDNSAVPFDPSRHSTGMLDEKASLKAGRKMVLEKSGARKAQPRLYVQLDVNSGSFNLSDISFHARATVILDALIKYSRFKHVDVYLSSGNNDYLRISPEIAKMKNQIITRLIRLRADRTVSATEPIYYGFQPQQGLPKNLLYLSVNEGKVNAVKYVLGRKTNVVAKTYSDVGLDIFSRMRVETEKDDE